MRVECGNPTGGQAEWHIPIQKSAPMDLKNLPDALEAIRKPVSDQLDIYARNERTNAFIDSEVEKLQKSVVLPAWATSPKDFLSLPEIEAQKTLALGTLGLPGLTGSNPQVLMERALIETEKALGFRGIENPTDARKYGVIHWEEKRREDAERRDQELLNQSVTKMQHIARETAEARKREDAKLEYARRSAEASEAALDAERKRTVQALETAAEARKETKIARRNMRISLWFAGSSWLLAAWPFIKDQF